jgi:hypothetical protein
MEKKEEKTEPLLGSISYHNNGTQTNQSQQN